MSDKIKMDSHKLIYHPYIVSKWLKGENIFPIEVEISPSGLCNHRCAFCAVDYLEYHPNFLKKDLIIEQISLMSSKGLKSVVCSGEGEPLLNKDMSYIANRIKETGIDVAMSTNGVFLTKDFVDSTLASFTWIRFSIAAIEEEIYQMIHKSSKEDLKKVLENISYAVQRKYRNKLNTTLGVQCILLPENQEQIFKMALQLRELGVDYFTIKPYSQHRQSKNHKNLCYSSLLDIEDKLKDFETENFKIYFRANSIRNLHKVKEYNTCYGLPFMTHIDSLGNVWPCVNFIGNNSFLYGNIYEESFIDIWQGNKRQDVLNRFKQLDINKICREACRLDSINKYLYDLKHPSSHVNFI